MDYAIVVMEAKGEVAFAVLAEVVVVFDSSKIVVADIVDTIVDPLELHIVVDIAD